ncbi:Cx9C motif-containing protein 4 [Trichoderma ghanense]|uniref:Cx9C motif-containing protein 4, mitochondrial n=1 Tax=Trichoderma ghanense TaxID=65468 RepID=A0ABY2HF49_9HYPO
MLQPSPKDDVEARPPCHPRAVSIPDCLTKNNYNEARCQDAVKALYECCDAFYRRYGDDASSPSCPKPNLLRLKMQQQKEGK